MQGEGFKEDAKKAEMNKKLWKKSGNYQIFCCMKMVGFCIKKVKSSKN